MKLYFTFGLVVMIVACRAQTVCDTAVSLNDATRLTTSPEANECDSGLAIGWYKWPNHRIPLTPPPGYKSCGTLAPGWIRLNATSHPSILNQEVNADVCFNFNYNNEHNTCRWHSPIRVKFCGTFYAYYLRPPPACYLRYCFERIGPLRTKKPTSLPTKRATTKRPTSKPTTSPTSCKPCSSIPCGIRNMASCMAASNCVWNKVLGTCGCSGIASDYVFVMDRSGSIGEDNAKIQDQIVNSIISTMVPEGSDISVITYSTNVNEFIKLTAQLTRADIVNRISNMPYSGGETYTEKALRTALKSPDYLGRASLKEFQRIVLITDGKSTDKPCNLAQDIATKTGLKVVILGVSSGFSRQDVDCLVAHQPNSAEWILGMPKFSLVELEKIRDKLEPKVCVTSESGSVQVLSEGVSEQGSDVREGQFEKDGWMVGVMIGAVVAVVCLGCTVAAFMLFKFRQKYERIPEPAQPTETTNLQA